MLYSFKNKEDLIELKNFRWFAIASRGYTFAKNLDDQKNYCESHKLFEAVTKAIETINKNSHEENRATKKAFEELNESSVFVKVS